MRELHWGAGGVSNPDGHLACGAKNPASRQLEPVHWGGCGECASVIAGIYKARFPRAKVKPIEQPRLPILEEDSNE